MTQRKIIGKVELSSSQESYRAEQEKLDRPLRRRAIRLEGYINDLLRESVPESDGYEVVAVEVDKYVNPIISPRPIKVRQSDKPTYEYYLKPAGANEPRKRVMIVRRSDLSARVVGGIPNEKTHYQIPYFREKLEKRLSELKSAQ